MSAVTLIDVKRALRLYALAAGVILATFLAGNALQASGYELVVNTSPSMPLGLYWMTRGAAPLQRGAVVMFVPPDGIGAMIYGRGWLRRGTPLLKTVGGLAGDEFCVGNRRFLVGGRDVGPTFLLDAQGHPLPQIAGCRRVSRDHFLPVASYLDRSFDGRYMGAVSTRNVLAVGRALVTF